ncbi:hypothetical protein LTR56_019143 [Elasticomyces elasticus]|uniref:Uncharacterized protein n=1 Tax=Elasticomyces elasticus TaxID=574655 RepID=A0AAN8A1P9_9PEZI|nr:hypothetical protein LTR56_019143 [Elasticomyces elasticus]KAK3635175.1 hypothetical protein LTR22_019316 [Elasticomyces elasticus]KAK4911516.1 hypothetical protein LTR49_019927 [Elasticomyces elasticus]KAK5695869.1 hypothetical protein LTR97_008289 [Elasticomyces elasticus]KAK5751061.1 hypothetical protein LTS12_018871 [Elasticomyces elasticus]
MYALASCLGQLKWLWFRRRVAYLIWLDRFSQASTAVGAVQLLFHLVYGGLWRSWACLGALGILGLLGTGLFVQNIVAQSTMTTISGGSAQIRVSRYYNLSYDGEHFGEETPVANMIASVTNGFAQPFVDLGSPMVPGELMRGAYECETSNCSMGLYSSLSVCPVCKDISHKIQTSDDFATLPDGSLSLSTNGLFNITSDTHYPDPTVLSPAEIGPLIVHYRAMAWGNGNITPIAVECVAYWCISTYQGNVVSNSLEEKVLYTHTDNTTSARTSYRQTSDIIIRQEQCWLSNKLYIDQQICAFVVVAKAQRAIQNFLAVGVLGSPAFLSGWQVWFGNSTRSKTTSVAAQILGDPCSIVDGDLSLCNKPLYAGLEAAFTNMTTFMTQAVRIGISNDAFNIAHGNASTTAYVFEIRWAWIAYPASTLLIVTAVVAGTVLQSRGEKSWKLSILPAVYHGIRDLNDEDYKRLVTPAQMRYEAETMSVKLDLWGEGLLWRTVKDR